MKYETYPKGRTRDLLTQELAGETLFYDLLKDKAYCLNDTSARIWKLCDGTRSVEQITNEFRKDCHSSGSRELVLLAIDQFKKDDLLIESNIPTLDSVSRREAIRKIGLGSTVALPLIAAIVVPRAAEAQSCLPPGSPCLFMTPPLCCTSCASASMIMGEPGTCS